MRRQASARCARVAASSSSADAAGPRGAAAGRAVVPGPPDGDAGVPADAAAGDDGGGCAGPGRAAGAVPGTGVHADAADEAPVPPALEPEAGAGVLRPAPVDVGPVGASSSDEPGWSCDA